MFVSLVFMLNRILRNKNDPLLVTDTTIQLYELAGIVQEDLFYQNQVSNLFCGEG